MAENEIKVRLQSAYKTEAEWTASNPILKEGEVGYVSDSNVPNYARYKIGDGLTNWKDLKWGDQSIYDKVDGIEIGGRNLILNSEFKNLSNSGIYSFSDGVVTFNSSAVGNTVSPYYFDLDVSKYLINCARGETLTFSMEYYIESEITYGTTNPWVGFQLYINRDSTTGGHYQYLAWYGGTKFPTKVTNKWIKHSEQVKVSDYDIASAELRFLWRDAKGKVKFRNPKIEIGNKDTFYTPAPEIKIWKCNVKTTANTPIIIKDHLNSGSVPPHRWCIPIVQRHASTNSCTEHIFCDNTGGEINWVIYSNKGQNVSIYFYDLTNLIIL